MVLPPPLPPLAGLPPVGGIGFAPVGSPAPVPWVADTLRPLFAEILPVLEQAQVTSLVAEAQKISPACGALVREKGGWPLAAKATLVQSLPELCVKWLNRFGISSEYAPELSCGVAIAAILASNAQLRGDIAKLAAEEKAAKERAEKKPS